MEWPPKLWAPRISVWNMREVLNMGSLPDQMIVVSTPLGLKLNPYALPPLPKISSRDLEKGIERAEAFLYRTKDAKKRAEMEECLEELKKQLVKTKEDEWLSSCTKRALLKLKKKEDF